ncbi:MAG: nucleotidyltransferase domain-containing protein [Actinomycetota bacterium]|nr:nucleotidyltransferase domain-containing protein [Actinomycetota bacterium]
MRVAQKRIDQEKIRKLRELFARNPKVIVAYFFGSQVRGEITPLSDIDIAVLVKESLSLDEKADLIGEIISSLETDNIDFVVLNHVSSVSLKFEVINGKVLYSANEGKRVDFETKVMGEYLLYGPMIDFYNSYFFREVREKYGG